MLSIVSCCTWKYVPPNISNSQLSKKMSIEDRRDVASGDPQSVSANPTSRPVRVVHVISSLSIGGAERLVADLLSRASTLAKVKLYLIVINDVVDEKLLSRSMSAGAEVTQIRRA